MTKDQVKTYLLNYIDDEDYCNIIATGLMNTVFRDEVVEEATRRMERALAKGYLENIMCGGSPDD